MDYSFILIDGMRKLLRKKQSYEMYNNESKDEPLLTKNYKNDLKVYIEYEAKRLSQNGIEPAYIYDNLLYFVKCLIKQMKFEYDADIKRARLLKHADLEYEKYKYNLCLKNDDYFKEYVDKIVESFDIPTVLNKMEAEALKVSFEDIEAIENILMELSSKSKQLEPNYLIEPRFLTEIHAEFDDQIWKHIDIKDFLNIFDLNASNKIELESKKHGEDVNLVYLFVKIQEKTKCKQKCLEKIISMFRDYKSKINNSILSPSRQSEINRFF